MPTKTGLLSCTAQLPSLITQFDAMYRRCRHMRLPIHPALSKTTCRLQDRSKQALHLQTVRYPKNYVGSARCLAPSLEKFLANLLKIRMLSNPGPEGHPAIFIQPREGSAVRESGRPRSQRKALQMLIQVVSDRVHLPPLYADCNHDDGGRRDRGQVTRSRQWWTAV